MSEAIDLGSVRRGFEHPALDAQRVYRRVLAAMSQPGCIQDLSDAPAPPAGLHRSTAGIALTLLDFETLVWLDPALRGGEAEAWLRFHCGSPLTTCSADADFALVSDPGAMPPLDAFNRGDARYPDRSTTVLLQVPGLGGGPTATLEGPGIDGRVTVAPAGLPDDFWEQYSANGAEFQLGVDLMVLEDEALLGLPRSARRVLPEP